MSHRDASEIVADQLAKVPMHMVSVEWLEGQPISAKVNGVEVVPRSALQAAEARATQAEQERADWKRMWVETKQRESDWCKELAEERARAERLQDALQDMYDNFSPPNTVDPRSRNDVDKAAAHAQAYVLLSSVPSAGQEGKQ